MTTPGATRIVSRAEARTSNPTSGRRWSRRGTAALAGSSRSRRRWGATWTALFPLLAVLVLSSGFAARTQAQPTLQIALRPEVTEVGQTAQLSVTVDGATNVESEPRVPPVDGLRFRRAGQSTNFSLINGKMTRSITFEFVIVADKAGEYTLGPVEVDLGKEILRSGKVKLQVVAAASPLPGRGSAPGAGGAPGAGSAQEAEAGLVFVEAVVDDDRVFLGQQVTLRLRFYQAVGFRVLETQLEAPPNTQGFLREEIPPQRTRTATVGGRTYQVTELVYGLFPTQTGALEIGEATIRCIVQDRRPGSRNRRDPFDLFGLFEEREVVLRSKPLRVNVEPLPAPRPADFTGGVGAFRLRSQLDRQEVEQNEPVTLSLSVEGTGNVAAIGAPRWPEVPGFRSFDGASPEVAPSQEDDRLGGKKTFQMVLVPETTGELVIPPIAFSYYRPSTGTYERLSTDSATVRVLPGTGGATVDGVRRLAWDLRDIRETTELRPIADRAPWHRPGFWILQSGPLALLAAAWAVRRRNDHEMRNARQLARERAPSRLRKEIAELARSTADPAVRLRLLDEAWTRFFEDRFAFPLRARTRDELVACLSGAGRDGEAVGRVRDLLSSLEFARFAPGEAVDVQGLLDRSRRVVEDLEKPAPDRRATAGAVSPLVLLGLLTSLGLAGAAAHRAFAGPATAQPPRSADPAVAQEPETAGGESAVGRDRAEAWFAEGNAAFRAGEPGRAAELYARVLAAGYESPDVWLNLGNAEFRAGSRGRAIHAFESGRRLDPSDPDLRSNLELALRDVESAAPAPTESRALRSLAGLRDRLPLSRTLPLVTAFWWLAAAAAAWMLGRRSRRRGALASGVVAGTLWLLGLCWIGVLAVHEGTRPNAVVIAESAPVRSNADDRATVEFHLPEGALFRTGRQVPGFVEVRYSEELRGWTEAARIARIGTRPAP